MRLAARGSLAASEIEGGRVDDRNPRHPEQLEGSGRFNALGFANAAWTGCFGGLTRVAVLLVLAVAVAAGSDAAAQGATPAPDGFNHAGLVIRHGDGRVTFAYVAFPEEEISGIDLLRRSGIEQVTIPFGGLGEGVCALEGEGCSATECRRRVCQAPGADSPYWRSFGLDETGVWKPFVLGASTAVVRDGDVHLWAWTSAEPGLAPVRLGEVARVTGAGEGGDSDGAEPPVSVRTVYPAGVVPHDGENRTDPLAYAVAAGVLLAIGAGALYAVRRARRTSPASGLGSQEVA